MNLFLFAAGLLLYAGYGLGGLAYLLAATLLSYFCGRLTPKCPWAAWLFVGLNAAVLMFNKVQPLLGLSLAGALGLSYFTLRILSYNVDVARGKYAPEGNFLRYGLYVTYFPSIFLGPIERYDSFRDVRVRFSWDGISLGAARILVGLFKKLVIAARAGVVVGAISAAPETYRGAYALAAMLLYSVQLYADFSGGIDMVLGVSQMLGISLSENFNTPYFSQSIAEFWRRWHMTLGGWLRDYVYIPLGGNRKGKLRKLLNTVITFLVSGLWHGGQYLLWGLFNGLFVCLGDKLKSRWKWLNQIGTFLVVSLLWAFFVWPDTGTALTMLGSLLTTFNYGAFFAGFLELGLNVGEWAVFFGACGLLWLYDWKKPTVKPLSPAGRVAMLCGLGLVILIFGMYGIGFNAEEFIYSRF